MTNYAKKWDNFQIDLCKGLWESELNKVSLIFEISFLFVLAPQTCESQYPKYKPY